jgi:ketosteroid isomerase-like protein
MTIQDVDLVAMFAALDRGDLEAMFAPMHGDVVVRLGNQPPIHGLEAFRNLYTQVAGSLGGIRHELHDLWTAVELAGIHIVRMTVHYTRLDGQVVSVPCCNIFRVRDGAISEYDVFVDMSPVFA